MALGHGGHKGESAPPTGLVNESVGSFCLFFSLVIAPSERAILYQAPCIFSGTTYRVSSWTLPLIQKGEEKPTYLIRYHFTSTIRQQ